MESRIILLIFLLLFYIICISIDNTNDIKEGVSNG